MEKKGVKLLSAVGVLTLGVFSMLNREPPLTPPVLETVEEMTVEESLAYGEVLFALMEVNAATQQEVRSQISWPHLMVREESYNRRVEATLAALDHEELTSILELFDGANGLCSFLGLRERDGRAVLRYRWLPDGGTGFDFIDLAVGRLPSGPRILDYYWLVEGEWHSTHLEKMLQYTPAANFVWRHANDLTEVARLAENPQEELVYYDSLPAELQLNQTFSSMHVNIAANLEDEIYVPILRDFLERFPNAPETPALRLSLDRIDGDRDAELRDVDALRALFDDPYWDAVEADIHIQYSEFEAALFLAKKVLERAPELVDGPDLALLACGDLEAADHYATMLRDDFEVDLRLLGYEGLDGLPSMRDAPQDHQAQDEQGPENRRQDDQAQDDLPL